MHTLDSLITLYCIKNNILYNLSKNNLSFILYTTLIYTTQIYNITQYLAFLYGNSHSVLGSPDGDLAGPSQMASEKAFARCSSTERTKAFNESPTLTPRLWKFHPPVHRIQQKIPHSSNRCSAASSSFCCASPLNVRSTYCSRQVNLRTER